MGGLKIHLVLPNGLQARRPVLPIAARSDTNPSCFPPLQLIQEAHKMHTWLFILTYICSNEPFCYRREEGAEKQHEKLWKLVIGAIHWHFGQWAFVNKWGSKIQVGQVVPRATIFLLSEGRGQSLNSIWSYYTGKFPALLQIFWTR